VPSAEAADTILGPGSVLGSGQSIQSPNGCFTLTVQASDGNVVLRAQNNVPIWATGTDGHPGTSFHLQLDGNLVARAVGNVPIWSTGTSGNPDSTLHVQDDGKITLRRPGNVPIWSSNTSHDCGPAPTAPPVAAAPPQSSAPAPQAARIVQIAQPFATGKGSTIDRRGENRNMFTRWYGLDGRAWCAMFTSYVFHEAGVPLARNDKGSAWTGDWSSGKVFTGGRATRFRFGPGADVRPGDVLYRSRSGGHVGIVESVSGASVRVIEGNTSGDAVTGRTYNLGGGQWSVVIRAPGL